MTASQVLDIVITTSKITEPSKTYKGDSSAFENVFNDVNKSYMDDDKSSSAKSDVNKQSSQTTEKESINEDKTTTKNESTQNKPEEKISEKDSPKDSATSDSSNPEKNSDENEPEITQDNNIENNDNNEKPKKIEIVETKKPSIETIISQDIIEAKTDKTKEVKTEIVTDETISKIEPETQESVSEVQDMPKSESTQNNISENQNIIINNNSIEDILPTISNNNEIINVLPADTKIIPQNDKTIIKENIAVNNLIQNNTQVNGLNVSTPNNTSTQNAIQKTQTLSEVQTESNIIPTEDSGLILQQNATSKAPTVQAETETIVANIDTKSIQANSNVLEETTLNQETLDEMEIKITNIESSPSSNADTSGSSLNKQNVQEQTVKLEIENSNTEVNTSNADLPDTMDINMPNNLGKGLNVQTNTVNQTQVPNFTHTAKDINQADITSQINNQLKTKSFQEEGLTKITIILKPENLGKINLELVSSKEGLTAQMTTDNPQVKEFLDKNLDTLKDSLGNQGVNVNNVSVKVETTQKQSSDMNAFEHQMEQNNQQSSDNTKNTNKNGFEFDKEVDEISDSNTSENTENENIPEDEAIISNHSGQIDYKV